MKNGTIRIDVLAKDRMRKISRGFGWIDRLFINDRHILAMGKTEVLLYFFLCVVSDAEGISFYGDRRICWLLGINLNELEISRKLLEQKGYIVYSRPVYQVLALPENQSNSQGG